MIVRMASAPSLSTRASGYLQAVALDAGTRLLRRLSPEHASDLGGWIARSAGPSLSISTVANINLQHALPHLDAGQRDVIIRAVWDNLGRTVAELPHLATLLRTVSGAGWELEGEAHLDGARAAGGQVLFFSGHFGNWEMVLPIAARLGLPVSGFYRAASNQRVDAVIQRMRGDALGSGVSMFAKGASGARAALLHLKEGGSLGMLTDQKMNDGIDVPLLGRQAMTAPALAQFALRFDAPVVPVHVVRLGPARLRLVCEAPLPAVRTGNRKADVYALTLAMNQTLERWIRADPASWLWLHRRWPKAATPPVPS